MIYQNLKCIKNKQLFLDRKVLTENLKKKIVYN